MNTNVDHHDPPGVSSDEVLNGKIEESESKEEEMDGTGGQKRSMDRMESFFSSGNFSSEQKNVAQVGVISLIIVSYFLYLVCVSWNS